MRDGRKSGDVEQGDQESPGALGRGVGGSLIVVLLCSSLRSLSVDAGETPVKISKPED